MSTRRAVAAMVVAWAAAAVAGAQTAVIDVAVNAYTTNSQFVPAVAMDAAGNFVVVWDSIGQDGSADGIFARRFDPGGSPLGPEFQVNSYTTDVQGAPSVAMRPDGEFVVVWQSRYQDGAFGGVYGRRFDAAGSPAGAEFRVNDGTLNAQRAPAVAMDDGGRFVVVWEGYVPDATWEVWGRQFDPAGDPLGPEFVVNSRSTDNQQQPKVAMDAAGRFVVVWESRLAHSIGTYCGFVQAVGRRFDASGAPLGPDFAIRPRAFINQDAPHVAVDPGGGFMVTWQDACSGDDRVSARVFDSAGVAQGDDFPLDFAPPPFDPYDHLIAARPAVAADEAGHFVVAWLRSSFKDADQDGYGYGYDQHVRLRRYDLAGQPLDAGSVASTFWSRTLAKGHPEVTGRAGRFTVVWDAWLQDGSGAGVFGRSPDVIFTDGFETADLSSWSSASIDGGDVTASSAAHMANSGSRYGLQVAVNDRSGVYVEDDSPSAEPRYRARFWLDPSGFDPGEAVSHFRQPVFLAFAEAPLKRLLWIVLKRKGGQYSIAAQVRQDDNTLLTTPFAPIAAGPTAIELDWQRASAPGANDGRLELWANGTSVATLGGLDNDERSIDSVRMGAMSVKDGAQGTLYFDEFVSRRLAYIGP